MIFKNYVLRNYNRLQFCRIDMAASKVQNIDDVDVDGMKAFLKENPNFLNDYEYRTSYEANVFYREQGRLLIKTLREDDSCVNDADVGERTGLDRAPPSQKRRRF